MIIFTNRSDFEYDLNSITKAFYPDEELHVITDETKEDKKLSLVSNDTGLKLFVKFIDNAASVWFENSQTDMREFSGTQNDKKQFKNEFKKFYYKFLSEVTGKSLPWGNLTGIRPTKIAYGLLNEGKSDEEIFAYYKEKHLVSDEKAALSLDIAKTEKELLSQIHCRDGYSLYIGIPFCPTTCLYCSFTSYPIAGYRNMVDDYIEAVIKELEYTADAFKGQILDTVYIGGGTPTTLEPYQLKTLIGRLRELFDFGTVKEFTVEAGRADSITASKLAVLKDMGVTRISVNPQTFCQKTLDVIGRKASVTQVTEAFELARKMGFDNINMDIILGLPGENAEIVQNTIDRVVQLNPDSLTVHSLAIKRGSRLYEWIKDNGVSTLNNTDETMHIAAQGAKQLQMIPYYLYRQKNMSGNFENVGYAKPGKLGIYNILIMEELQSIVACGAGVVSKRVSDNGITRCDNVKEVPLYIEKIDEMTDRKRKLFS